PMYFRGIGAGVGVAGGPVGTGGPGSTFGGGGGAGVGLGLKRNRFRAAPPGAGRSASRSDKCTSGASAIRCARGDALCGAPLPLDAEAGAADGRGHSQEKTSAAASVTTASRIT